LKQPHEAAPLPFYTDLILKAEERKPRGLAVTPEGKILVGDKTCVQVYGGAKFLMMFIR
jgi:hypothetical protein